MTISQAWSSGIISRIWARDRSLRPMYGIVYSVLNFRSEDVDIDEVLDLRIYECSKARSLDVPFCLPPA